ncbi:MAG TPA: tetratricopeptide repeat protein [Chloroflexia bacterium]|nr:tetratricopeptide repeat protein [Chloroflexia bacterium]
MEQSATELINQAEQALLNEEWPKALDLYNRALVQLDVKTAPEEAAEIENGRGVALLQLERYAEAIKALESALLLVPDMASAYYNLGITWESMGNFENALHSYNKAIELEPHDAEAYFRRGGVWFQLEDFEKTLADATKTIELHQGNILTGPYIARGLALYRLERYQEALKDFNKALEADPREAAEAFFYRALVYIDIGQALPARADLQAYLTMTEDLDGVLAEQAREIIAELEKQA